MKYTRIRTLQLSAIATFVVIGVLATARGDYPKPSVYPIAWELKLDHSKPKRIVVDIPTESGARAYWYMTYTVTNNSDAEQTFLPVFELLTRDGRVIRSDNNIPAKVLDAVRQRERNKALESSLQIGGELRVGEDQAKEGVAIWLEPERRMGSFSIFVGGLSGEVVAMKDSKGEPMKDKDGRAVILRKTLQLNYQVPGDEVRPGEDPIIDAGQDWVMR